MQRIVLIEDDRFTREDLKQGLLEAGHEVVAHSGGRKALEAILSDPPDCVVTDIIMEDGEGINVITTIRERCADVGVIAMSSDKTYLNYAAMLGADQTIRKPLSPRLLLEAIEQLPGRSRPIRATQRA